MAQDAQKAADAESLFRGYAGTMGAGIAAAGLSFIAYKVYQVYVSKAKIACMKSSNPEECIKKFRQNALDKQITKLTSLVPFCKKSRDSNACADKIKARLQLIRSRRR
jgi:Tfp pilus assembly major pilin PilA